MAEQGEPTGRGARGRRRRRRLVEALDETAAAARQHRDVAAERGDWEAAAESEEHAIVAEDRAARVRDDAPDAPSGPN